MHVWIYLYSFLTSSSHHDHAAGFAGDDAPRSVFPSLIGRARQPGIMVRLFVVCLSVTSLRIDIENYQHDFGRADNDDSCRHCFSLYAGWYGTT